MLIGYVFHPIIPLLEGSHYKFYLTGSRFFGDFTENSDYDFFVEYSGVLGVWLKDNGFTVNWNVPYLKDDSVCDVYQKADVHIQMIHPHRMVRKIKAQDRIARLVQCGMIDLKIVNKRELWQIMMH